MNEHALETDPDFKKYPRRNETNRDMDNDKYDTLPVASPNSINSSSRNARNIVLAQTRWIVSPDTTRQTPKASPVQNNKQKQQIVLSKHAVLKLTTTNVTFTTLDGQPARPTIENIDDNSILSYRKPPDS